MRHLALECNRRIVLEPIPYSTIALFAGRKPLLSPPEISQQKEKKMSIPESPLPQPQSEPQPQPRKRPYWLRTMLIVWMIFSAMSLYIYLRSLSGVWIAITPLGHPKWTLPWMGLLSLVNLVCVIAIWKWKRRGMYGLIVSAAVMFIITLISLNLTNAILSVSGVIIIALLVRKVWSQMD
jgi:hypothetical protein